MPQTAAQTTSALRDLTPNENKAIFRRYIDELWNQGNIAIIDDIMHPDLHCHPPSFQGHTYKADMPGIIQAFHRAFPAGRFTFSTSYFSSSLPVWRNTRLFRRTQRLVMVSARVGCP